jgi:HAD superfamily hydrolase (TIGR01458 family)
MIEGGMRAILFDMDGVLYNSGTAIEGATETLNWVRAQGIPHLFVTNTSSRGRDVLIEKLARFGVVAAKDEILTPAAQWLRMHTSGPVALFVKPVLRDEFAGLLCIGDEAVSGARYVVIGDLGEAWDFRTLNRAFRLLHSDPESTLIALGMTKFWEAPDGLSLDVAPFVAALEHAARRKAVVFGKPARAFFEMASEKLGVPAADILMVGDDIEIDVAGAQEAGLKGALVRTGKFRPPDLDGAFKPDFVLDSVADLRVWWERYG